MSTKIVYVKNLPISYNTDTIKQIFSDYGEIIKISYPVDKKTKQAKGYAFITFANSDAAERALEKNGDTIEEKKLVVELSRDQTLSDVSKKSGNRKSN